MNFVCPHAPVPTQQDRDEENKRHARRCDITPAMVAADPDKTALWWDMCRAYGEDVARSLFAIAYEQAA